MKVFSVAHARTTTFARPPVTMTLRHADFRSTGPADRNDGTETAPGAAHCDRAGRGGSVKPTGIGRNVADSFSCRPAARAARRRSSTCCLSARFSRCGKGALPQGTQGPGQRQRVTSSSRVQESSPYVGVTRQSDQGNMSQEG